MARQDSLHWTADPRFSYLRNPPLWHRRRTNFCLRAPKSKMDKRSANERHSQWQWQGSDQARDGFAPMLAESVCLPWAVYSRTWSRLRAALAGYDALSARHKKKSCTFDCTTCVVCCPFYGCFFARLQTTVRTFYGIKGTDAHDWLDGCCCPCCTLMRNEQEILLREKHHKRLRAIHDPDGSVTSQYQSYLPMSYTCSKSATGSPKVAPMRPESPRPADKQPAGKSLQQATEKQTSAVPLVQYLQKQ
ncbi:hypothetical protein JDV02_005632 [Purpureocillium takamizusanense]|uniref:Uncharacterized protein n=1 Tax=Purpureocillium takamizusanense TaxID=2060973 RepID=A0A9Q8QGX8_9HYPO|nr:uncharacterized protein JDV02_005632 [Purpureocillium takamizusanense]UNI19450.1 hypothetical protein JDV02_005632 [Purpureocillium takamizusanense]